MKKILAAITVALAIGQAGAQMKEGKVTYARTMQMQMRFSGGAEHLESMLPKSRTDNFELFFGNNQSLWRQAEKEMEDETINSGGMQIRMVATGADDVLFTDFASGKRVELRDFMDKHFIIDDSVRAIKWKVTGESKVILDQNCMKATATQFSRRTQTVMVNGNLERKEIDDTTTITAWFAPSIPVSAGPAEYQGQLPGLILEMDLNNGRLVFKAIELSPKVDLAIIKAPTGKKRYTTEEFNKEREKMMDEMQRNNGGRSFRIGGE